MKSQQTAPRRLAGITTLAVCLATAGTGLTRAAENPAAATTARGPLPSRPSAVTTVLGSAWKADNSPLPEAKLRLRSLITGRIEAATVADFAGQFAFPGVEGGTYVVELVNDSGRVLAVGLPFAIMRGETVATFVRLSEKSPRFAGFFENAAAAAIASAASLGVTALAPTAPPVSAKR